MSSTQSQHQTGHESGSQIHFLALSQTKGEQISLKQIVKLERWEYMSKCEKQIKQPKKNSESAPSGTRAAS